MLIWGGGGGEAEFWNGEFLVNSKRNTEFFQFYTREFGILKFKNSALNACFDGWKFTG